MHPNSSFLHPKHIAVSLIHSTQNIVTKYKTSHIVAIHQAYEHYYSAFQQYFHPTYILYCVFSRTSDILNRCLKISWTLVSLDHAQICIWLISAKCVQEYQFPNYAVIKSDFPGRKIKWPGILENSLSVIKDFKSTHTVALILNWLNYGLIALYRTVNYDMTPDLQLRLLQFVRRMFSKSTS